MNEFLEQLRANQNFRNLLDEIRTHRPVIPAYNPGQDNTEEWKAASLKQQGFDLFATLLGEDLNE